MGCQRSLGFAVDVGKVRPSYIHFRSTTMKTEHRIREGNVRGRTTRQETVAIT